MNKEARTGLLKLAIDHLFDRGHVDLATLAPALRGGYITRCPKPERTGDMKISTKKANEAYRVVAFDLLGCLVKAGVATRTQDGWWVPKGSYDDAMCEIQ